MSFDQGLSHITTFLATIAGAKSVAMKDEELNIIAK